jgi:putative transposase
MKVYETFRYTTWECKYHVVFIPKCRRKVLFGQLRGELGVVSRALAEEKESEIMEGHLMPDHVHMMISVPPKYSVSQVAGYLKEKSAMHIARVYAGRRKNFGGRTFGRDDTGYRRSEKTRRRCVDTSRSRRRKTNASNR